jgi:hypothetical protein
MIFGTNGANVICMNFQWPDPISCIADLVTLVGIPTLAYSTRKLYRDAKKARVPQSVSHECLEFYDVDDKVGVNLVPLTEITAIPRPGDTVLLPGETHGFENWGGGSYKVQSVVFIYIEDYDGEVDQPCAALTSKISVSVQKIKDERPE